MNSGSITQKQIAERIGISQPLVAMALRDHPRVAEKTRAHVREVALAMGYDLNANGAARALANKRHGNRPQIHTIGVLLADLYEMAPVKDLPFFVEILQGIKEEAERRQVEISFCPVLPGRLPRLVREGSVEAVALLYCHPHNELLQANPLSMPSLIVGDASEGDWSLMPDNHAGIYQAAKHLIDLGHRRIGYFGSLTSNVAYTQRWNGFQQAMGEAGLAIDPILLDLNMAPNLASGAKALRELYERTQDFTAIVCYNDQAALGAIDQCQKLGLRVPEDVSVTGFDGTNDVFGGTQRLTTVFFDRRQMGQRMVNLICQAADDCIDHADDPMPVFLDVQLLPGDSTAPVSPHVS